MTSCFKFTQMKESEKKELKSIIDDQIASVKEEIEELTELTRPVSLDASIGRLSRMDAINNKAINEMALRDKKQVMNKLERALERYSDDKLGKCLKCGNEIAFGRLKIMPYTTRCVSCSGR